MRPMFINGEFVDTQESIDVINPATEEVIDTVPRGRADDVDLAVQSAVRAFDDWRFAPGLERCELLHEVAHRARAAREPLAQLLTLEGGKPLIENMDEIEWVAACFDYYAEIGRNDAGRVIVPVQRHQMNFVVKEAVGVVACIVPWNYPLLLLAWKIAPALAAGNSVVIKPSEHTPLATLMLMETAFRDFPPGVVNVVTGYGAEAGEPLVAHRGTDIIAFTGSVATGRRIASVAADRLKRLNLELGGNDPFIICDDADVEVAARGAAWAAFLNMGQVCTSGERFYVMEPIADAFISRLVEFTKTLRIGNPVGPDVDLGPMISAEQRDKVERKLDRVREMGAEVLCGGRRPEAHARGFYFEPTVVTGVDHSMPLMREETFGPIAPVMVTKTFEEAVALANDSDYGLGANILTTSLERAMYAAERIKAGTFWINDPLTDNDAGPFGGMRMSGMGRELGPEALEAFRDTKHIHLDYKLETKPYWYPYDWSKGRKTD